MKTFRCLLLLLLLPSVQSLAQTTSVIQFSNIPWLASETQVRNMMKSKNYKFLEKDDLGLIYKGVVMAEEARIYILFDLQDRLAKVAVFLLTDDDKAISRYFEMIALLKSKYGEPRIAKMDFESPYELGDGDEQSAIRAGKADFRCLWVNQFNDYLGVEITKDLTVQIMYESRYWPEVSNVLMRRDEF